MTYGENLASVAADSANKALAWGLSPRACTRTIGACQAMACVVFLPARNPTRPELVSTQDFKYIQCADCYWGWLGTDVDDSGRRMVEHGDRCRRPTEGTRGSSRGRWPVAGRLGDALGGCVAVLMMHRRSG